jgi:hypothetical protein
MTVVDISEEGIATVAGPLQPPAGDTAPCRWIHVLGIEDVPAAMRAVRRPGGGWQRFRVPFAGIDPADGWWGPRLSASDIVVHVTEGGVVSVGSGSTGADDAVERLRKNPALRAAGPIGVVCALVLAAGASVRAAHAAVADNLDAVTDQAGTSSHAIDVAFAAREQALKLHGLARRLNTEWSRLPADLAGGDMETTMTEVTVLAEWAADVWSFALGKSAMYQNETMARLAAWSLSAVVPSIFIALVSLIAAVSTVGRNPVFLAVAAVAIAGVSFGVYVFLRRRGLL